MKRCHNCDKKPLDYEKKLPWLQKNFYDYKKVSQLFEKISTVIKSHDTGKGS